MLAQYDVKMPDLGETDGHALEHANSDKFAVNDVDDIKQRRAVLCDQVTKRCEQLFTMVYAWNRREDTRKQRVWREREAASGCSGRYNV